MFGRGAAPPSDAAALARRRLAALTAQLGVEPAGSALPPVADDQGPDSRGGRAGRADDFDAERAEWIDDERLVAAPLVPRSGRHSVRSLTHGPGRWGLDPQHVTVLALLVAVVLAVAGLWVLRASPHATPVKLANERTLPSGGTTAPVLAQSPTPIPGGGVTGGSESPASATSSSTGTVVVDVTGKVRRPGIVELPAGSRVNDALVAAGGARPGVHTGTLNLARLLVDGEQIVVGFKVPVADPLTAPTPAGAATSATIASVDLNTATQDQLETLPGIGPVTSAAILQWRTENGSFTSVDQLLDVSGIGDITLANIRAYVHV